MNPLHVAAIATALSVGVSLADKFLTGKLSPRPILAVIGLYGFACLLLLPLTDSALPSGLGLAVGVGIGVLFTALIVCAFTAIKQEEISRLAPLGILSTILIIAGSVVFFDEPMTTRKGVAFFFFLTGAFLLSTRFERRLEILDPDTYIQIASVIGRHTQQTLKSPFEHPLRLTRKVGTRMVRNVRNFFGSVAEGKLLVVRSRIRVRLVKGFWWYLAAILLSVPYVLTVTWLTKEEGVVSAFTAVRLGLGIGALLYVGCGLREVVTAVRMNGKAFVLAAIKEPFGIGIGFLLAYAYANAPLGSIRAITSFEAAGIFLTSIVLGRLGIVPESLRARDLVQKGIGVCCMVAGSLILFV
jgi:multidrug transporter EmrE-like cation transporter